jgi:hypothetical protein
MSLTPIPLLATSLKSLTRSLLFSLGLDHALIDFLALTALGAATVLLAILFVGIGIPRRSRTRQ